MSRKGYQVAKDFFFAMAFLILAACPASAAGTGTIKGNVLDSETKDALPGANVLVKGTSIGAATDLNGSFVIHNVPSGAQTLVISYVGYVSLTQEVNIPDGQTLEQNFLLQPTAVQGKVVVVTAQAQGQMQAINQQLASNKIVNVVSAAKIQELPDFNAAEAIGRLPGISTLRSSGEANQVVIRGIAPQYNLVSIDGISLGATSKYNRGVDLTMITPYMLQSIEVYKSLTPDQDADAIGGIVNMQLREAPRGLHSDLMWQSGYTAKTKKYGNYKAVGAISDRFFDDRLGVYVLLNAESYDRSADNFNASYGIASEATAGEQYANVRVNNMTLIRHLETRNRYGGNLIMDYKLGNGSIQFINMLSRLNSRYQDYQTQYDYIGRNLNWNYGRGNGNTDLAVNALQGRYDFGFMSFDVSAANSYTRNFTPQIANFQFGEGSGIATTSPINTPPQDLVNLTRFDSTKSALYVFGYNSADYKENDQKYAANFKIPFTFGSDVSGYFKTGGVFRYNYRTNDESAPFARINYGGQQGLRDTIMAHWPELPYSTSMLDFYAYGFSDYNPDLLSPMLNGDFGSLLWVPRTTVLDQITSYVYGQPDLNQTNYWYAGPYQNMINDYRYIERYYAAYGMAEIDLGPKMMIVGGARYEMDKSQFSAYQIKDVNNPRTNPYKYVTVYPKNHFWLPMIQAKYDLGGWGDIRYSYTQTLARPDFTQLTPGWNVDQPGQVVNAGNPNLVPARSYNHDLMFTIHSNDIGLISAGAFYKTVENFSYFTTYWLLAGRTLPGYDTLAQYPGAQSGASLNTYYNNPYKAYLRGLEGDFQTRLWYLPAPFNGIVLGVNYTHIWSSTLYPYVVKKTTVVTPPGGGRPYNVDSLVAMSRGGRLLDQPDDIVNASIGYDYKGFSGRVSFLYQGSAVSGIGSRVEQDGFTHDYFRIDASVRQLLPVPGLQLYLDVNNLNQRADISAQQTIGGFTSERYYGMTADLGIRYTL